MSGTFGRRATPPGGSSAQSAGGSSAPPPGAPPQLGGHELVLQHLSREEASKPHMRQQLAGKIFFDFVWGALTKDGRLRIDDVLALISAVGGFACIVFALRTIQALGRAAPGSLVTIDTKAGERFYFGDLPNRALLESDLGFLNLALGMARAEGASVSLETAQDTIKHVAATVGEPEFGVPRLPQDHMPRFELTEIVKAGWPKVVGCFELYKVPGDQWHTALGFAVQHAIQAGKSVIDPNLAAKIVIECAVPMAKLDPAALGFKV